MFANGIDGFAGAIRSENGDDDRAVGFVEWQFSRAWENTRDALVILYIFLRFHAKFIEAVGLLIWTPMAGGRPIIVKPEWLLYLLLLMGLWRLAVDPAWRSRLGIPYLGLQVAAAFGLIAMLAWNSAQAMQITQSLYVLPLILFAAGIITGVTRRRLIAAILAIAAVNFAVTLITSVFFMNLFNDMLVYLNILVQRPDMMAWRGSKNPYVSTGLIIYFVTFNVFVISCFAVSLWALLFKVDNRKRLIYYALIAVCALVLAFAGLSRGTIATCVLVLLLLYYFFIRQRMAEGRASFAQAMRLTALGLIGVIALVIAGRAMMKTVLPSRDIFDPTTFVSEQFEVGRSAVWENVIEDLNRKGGWLTGVTQMQLDGFDSRRPLRYGESRYFATDNLYLAVIVRCGVIGLFFKLMFLGILLIQLSRARAYMELTAIIAGGLVWDMLISDVLLQSLFVFAGAALLADMAKDGAFAFEPKLASKRSFELSRQAGRV